MTTVALPPPEVVDDLDLERAFLDADESFCHIKDAATGNGQVRPFLCGQGFGVVHAAGKWDGAATTCPACGRPICPDCLHANAHYGRAA